MTAGPGAGTPETPFETGVEVPLEGGFANAGAVVRVGNTVRRPPWAYSSAVHALLLHLEAVGFDGAPRYLGTDDQGRDVLTFVEGDAPLPPYPAWSMSEAALVEMARLLRRYHDAVASFDHSAITAWCNEWSDPLGGSLICHNDVFPENVVFRDGIPVALIDFDVAAPGRPMWDIAVASQEWAPIADPATRLYHSPTLDGINRLGRFARAYGVGADDAPELVRIVFEERAQALANIRRHVADGQPFWTEHWATTDGESRAATDDAWLARHRDALEAAIVG